MKLVGSRLEPQLALQARGDLLADGARWSEALAHLSQAAFIPKGVYRFPNHEAANQQERECLARAMAIKAEVLRG